MSIVYRHAGAIPPAVESPVGSTERCCDDGKVRSCSHQPGPAHDATKSQQQPGVSKYTRQLLLLASTLSVTPPALLSDNLVLMCSDINYNWLKISSKTFGTPAESDILPNQAMRCYFFGLFCQFRSSNVIVCFGEWNIYIFGDKKYYFITRTLLLTFQSNCPDTQRTTPGLLRDEGDFERNRKYRQPRPAPNRLLSVLFCPLFRHFSLGDNPRRYVTRCPRGPPPPPECPSEWRQ